MTPGDQESMSPRPQQCLSSRFQDFMRPGRQELLRSGFRDLWSSGVQELMISGHQGFLTSGDQDAKTSIRIDFLASLFHDGLSSRFIHSVLVQFCSQYRLRERAVRLFRLAGEQAGTGRDLRPVFESPEHYMFGTQQAVFSVTRNILGNENSLPARGWKTPPKSSFFTGATVARPEFPTAGGFSPASLKTRSKCGRNSIIQHSKTGLYKHKKGGRFCRIIPSNRPHSARFSAEKSSQTGTISERSETFFNPGSQQSEFEFRQKRQRVRVQKRADSPVGNRPFLNSSSPNSQPFGTGKWLSEST